MYLNTKLITRPRGLHNGTKDHTTPHHKQKTGRAYRNNDMQQKTGRAYKTPHHTTSITSLHQGILHLLSSRA
jgi:hypothetical protein